MVKCSNLSLSKIFDLIKVENPFDDTPINYIGSYLESEDNLLTFYQGNSAIELDKINFKNWVLSKPGLKAKHPKLILCPDPYSVVLKLLNKYASLKNQRLSSIENPNVHPSAIIADDVEIPEHCEIGPNVVIHSNTILGEKIKIQSGAVIGNRGFGFHTAIETGESIEIPHFGGVVLSDGVHIGANSVISSGFLKATFIGTNTKIDSLVMIGHNCHIGEDCFIAGQGGMAGSCVLGDRVLMGAGAQLSQGVHIGDDAKFTARAGVIGNVPANEIYSGFPARPHKQWLKGVAWLRKNQK